MLVLGIESSCDETAAAVVVDGEKILSNVVASQVLTHEKYGGVVPELASREHLRKIAILLKPLAEARYPGPLGRFFEDDKDVYPEIVDDWRKRATTTPPV